MTWRGANSINNPSVFKLFEAFGAEKVRREFSHLPRLSNKQIVLKIFGIEPAQWALKKVTTERIHSFFKARLSHFPKILKKSFILFQLVFKPIDVYFSIAGRLSELMYKFMNVASKIYF